MPTKIKLTAGKNELHGELNESDTAQAVIRRLPLEFSMSRWGEEYYGNIGKSLGIDEAPDAREEMEIGELAYWVPGNALCVFFGPTPASSGSEPRAASPVNPIGKVTGDVQLLSQEGGSIKMRVELA